MESSKKQPLVSIIIPSYNRELYICETLNSILEQTYTKWECIIVDDGSKDTTIPLVQEYCNKDKRFKLYCRKKLPKGAPTCRNLGLEYSCGEYIIFLDSDDILAKHCLENRVSYMKRSHELDFAVFKGKLFTNIPEDSQVLISSNRNKEVIPLFLSFDIPWITLNPIYKKSSLLINNIKWHEGLEGFQDIQFHLLCICKNLKFEISNNTPDCYWRFYEGEKIGNKLSKLKYINSNIEFLVIIKSYLTQAGLFSKEHQKYINHFLYQKANQIISEKGDIKGYYKHLIKNQLKSKREGFIEKSFFYTINLSIKPIRAIAFRLFHFLYWHSKTIEIETRCFMTHQYID